MRKKYTISEETRQKISLSNKGKILSDKTKQKISNTLLGHIVTKDTRKKISIAHLGKKLSEETKQKLSKIQKNIIKSQETLNKIAIKNTGKKRTPEQKKKMSLAHIGKKQTEETKLKISKNHAKSMLNKKHSSNTIIKIKAARLKQPHTWESSIEKKIQEFLTEFNIPFKKHKIISDIKHKYQCDIFIPNLNMIIECDGDYWHNYPNSTEIDKIRNTEIKNAGYKLLRLWEKDIRNIDINQFKKILCESYYSQLKI